MSNSSMNLRCPVCGGSESLSSGIRRRLPESSGKLVSHLGEPTTTTDFQLVVCDDCSHGFNGRSQSPITNESIYNSRSYTVKSRLSGSMSKGIEAIFNYLRENAPLSSVLEIASGSGALAAAFAQAGAAVTTVDPAVDGYSDERIQHHREFYGERTFESGTSFGLIIARHFLEHVHDPVGTLRLMLEHLSGGPSRYVYIETPDFNEIVAAKRYFDLFSDHVQYFTPHSIAKCIDRAGGRVVDSLSIQNGAHMGLLVARADQYSKTHSSIPRIPLKDAGELEELFGGAFSILVSRLEQEGRICLYGAGAHAVTLSALLPEKVRQKIVAVVDRDPVKIGRWIAGIHAPISAPESLDWSAVDVVLNSAILYKNEVEEFVHSLRGGRIRLIHAS